MIDWAGVGIWIGIFGAAFVWIGWMRWQTWKFDRKAEHDRCLAHTAELEDELFGEGINHDYGS